MWAAIVCALNGRCHHAGCCCGSDSQLCVAGLVWSAVSAAGASAAADDENHEQTAQQQASTNRHSDDDGALDGWGEARGGVSGRGGRGRRGLGWRGVQNLHQGGKQTGDVK